MNVTAAAEVNCGVLLSKSVVVYTLSDTVTVSDTITVVDIVTVVVTASVISGSTQDVSTEEMYENLCLW